MGFEDSLPFVTDVYALIGEGRLVECEKRLREIIQQEDESIFHVVLDLQSEKMFPGLDEWLFAGCEDEPVLDSSMVIGLSMGEFEINYDNWKVDASILGGYSDPPSKYDWFASGGAPFLCEDYTVEGLDQLADAFEAYYCFWDENDLDEDTVEPPVSATVFTATCYLVYTLFLKVIRKIHEQARDKGHDIARVHLFGFYGGCLYHSPPLADSRKS
jgi:hypothetical protein